MSRILSLDYGDVRIGLAISDPLQIIAKPFHTIKNSSIDSVIQNINNIIEEKDVEKIIIGLPITLKNKHSQQTESVLKFIEKIQNKISIPIENYDERFTSQIAKQSLIFQGVKTGHNKSDIDKTAAAIFLQNYLDEKNNNK